MTLVLGALAPHPPLLVPEIGGARVAQVASTRDALQALSARVADLAGVESAERQVDIARRKADIASGETLELLRFRVRRYEKGGVAAWD